jgi:hypothetical protein
VLRDQVRNTFELLEVRREREYRQGYKSPKSDDGEMSVADFERWLSPFADDLPISHIPPFAKGYPRISKAELARLIATCTEGENAYLENDFTERWMAHFLEDPVRDPCRRGSISHDWPLTLARSSQPSRPIVRSHGGTPASLLNSRYRWQVNFERPNRLLRWNVRPTSLRANERTPVHSAVLTA